MEVARIAKSMLQRETAAVRTLDGRRRYILLAFASLLALLLAVDYSIYAGGLAHLYIHEAATLAVFVLGVTQARRRRAWLPARGAIWIPLALIALLGLDTIITAAVHYPSVPVAMRRLFWFEHGDALRILGVLFIWIWTYGQLEPTWKESLAIFDIGLWAGVFLVVITGAYWLLNGIAHTETTTFDLTVMVGEPLALAFMIRRQMRPPDVIRLAIYAGAGFLLYSRTAIAVVLISSVLILLSVRPWRRILPTLAPLVVGGAAMIGATLLIGMTSGSGKASFVRPPPVASVEPPAVASGSVQSGSSTSQALRRASTFGGGQGDTLSGRQEIWKDALRIFNRAPLVGVGYHDYFLYSSVVQIKVTSIFDIPGLDSSRVKQAHNDYLSMLAETGVVGLLVYLSFWALLLASGARQWWLDRDNRVWHTAVLGFLASLAVVGFFGEVLIPRTPTWVSPAILWWFLIATLLMSVENWRLWKRPSPVHHTAASDA